MSSFQELVEMMSRLRGKGGCPWDKKQTHETIKPYLIEEAYEVVETIDRKDDERLQEELGDLLLQVLFHAQIAREEGRFDIEGVIEKNIAKLRRRHPHVFGDVKVKGAEEVLTNWEKIKRSEGGKSLLDGVPPNLPALLRAQRIQEKAARAGFDWERPDEVMRKIEEEFAEFKKAYSQKNPEQVEEELGDIIFSFVNLGRFLGICLEDALRKTVNRFDTRFRFIESKLEKLGKDPKEVSLDEMNTLWEKAKEEVG